ncbi:MAG: c-type cytochrome [Zavarzinia sp.]|nr:c-type cytochrome [Zavarzinia sp.]
MALLTAFVGVASMASRVSSAADAEAGMVQLGRDLFFDTDLSRNRTMACATCHAPEFAFTDPRTTNVGRAVSLGDDGVSIGARNTPTITYAAAAPAFGTRADHVHAGGMFMDGRAADLAEQAGGPPLNPIEMAMPDKTSIVERLKEKPDYVRRFRAVFGDTVFASDDAALAAMTKAIASFEATPEISPFDSRYDRYLRGEYVMTAQEELGRVLFFSRQFTNCNLCHQVKAGGAEGETFTNYTFHNIGTPANPDLATGGGPDLGLAANPLIEDKAAAAGRFKVPSLRNVAVTGPYMHNGVFKDLRTVILFYNKYNTKAERRQIDPETGRPWAPPEVADNLARVELETGPALDDRRIEALIAFLRTLTDRRFEPLLDNPPAR